MIRTIPYTWRVGVDNAFGYLRAPDGRCHLAESRRFLSGVGLAVCLGDGGALLTVADGRSTWQPLTAERACRLADIPAPAVDGAAETARRLDPFHVERHCSPLFLTLVALASERRLPCGHALRAWRAGAWDGTFEGPFLEQPETFAASVLERIALARERPADAVLCQLASDLMLVAGGSEHLRATRESGWQAVLGEIPGRVAGFTARLLCERRLRREEEQARSAQLALI